MSGFQVVTPVKLGQAALTAVIATVYGPVAANTRTMVKCIDLCNTTAGVLTATVHLVPSGGAAAAANMLIPGITLNGNTPFQWTGTQVLNAGDTIQALSSGAGVTINVSGGEAV